MIELILQMFWAAAVLIISAFAHEFGHKAFIDNIGRTNVKMRWNLKDSLYLELPGYFNRKEKNQVIIAGILAGFIPMFLLSSTLTPLSFAVIFTLYFIVGCRHDIILLGKINSEKFGERLG